MSSKVVCHYNKFGFCKFGNSCFRYHENKVCEDSKCKVLECRLRHPRKCSYFRDYYYCKFGSYCKFSHENKERDDKSIEVLENKIFELTKEINKKDTEIKMINQDIQKAEETMKTKISKMYQKNEALEKEIKEVAIDLKAVKNENQTLKSCLAVMEEEIKSLKHMNNVSDKVQSESIEEEVVTADIDQETEISNHACDRCEFRGKTEAGLKTHKTIKHKGSILRAYTKVSK